MLRLCPRSSLLFRELIRERGLSCFVSGEAVMLTLILPALQLVAVKAYRRQYQIGVGDRSWDTARIGEEDWVILLKTNVHVYT